MNNAETTSPLDYPALVIRERSADRLAATRHPWIFRSALTEGARVPDHGAVVRVQSERGTAIGVGFYSALSKIACRLVFGAGEEPGTDWIGKRIREAVSMRTLFRIPSNAVRLVNAEGDFFPGLIVDLYHETLVIRPEIRGVELVVPAVQSVLEDIFPGKRIFLKRDERAARIE
ncbi:MAG TPA: hypothetical protein ENN69_03235, partial [Spirochaetia bacterium]|nr:hypothetical protein [Spirochaetia bacterium]